MPIPKLKTAPLLRLWLCLLLLLLLLLLPLFAVRAELKKDEDGSTLVLVPLAETKAAKPAQHGIIAFNFDWDDNLMFMKTKIIVYKKGSKDPKDEKEVSTGDFAVVEHLLGKSGSEWENYEKREGSYQQFRDKRGKNNFLDQINEAMLDDPSQWKGPSWDAFVEACSRRETARHVSILTARGHSPWKMHAALKELQRRGFIKFVPPVKNLIAVEYPKFVTKDDTATRKAFHMKAMLNEVQKQEVRGEGEVVNQDGTRKAKLHLWGFSDDSFTNFEAARRTLGEEMAGEENRGRWDKIKITLFYTGTKQAGVEPHAVVLTGNGEARDLTPIEVGEAKRLMRDETCENYFQWVRAAAEKRALLNRGTIKAP